MDIKEIIDATRNPADVISDLSTKSITVPEWSTLEKQYDPKKHPIMNDSDFIEGKHTRITIAAQRLAVKRMTELLFGIEVQRICNPQDESQEFVANVLKGIFTRNRIASVDIERGRNLYAACETVTIWYAQEQTVKYGDYESPLKLRCRNYSPKDGHSLYPLFDEYDDLVAFSVKYSRDENGKKIEYFETYTAEQHIRWRIENGVYTEELREDIARVGKIPAIYIHRDEPIWEDQSENISEAEYTLSRNGNYIRRNARPTFVIKSDSKVKKGQEKDTDSIGRNVLRIGASDSAEYATWNSATDSIKYHVEEILRLFFLQLQLPDFSMDNMKQSPLSGESRKMLFIDGQMKAQDESGVWLEAFDREINVLRAFLHIILPDTYSEAIDTLPVEVVITPYQIQDEAEKIANLTRATGNKAIMSTKTAIRYLDYADDVDEELKLIQDEEEAASGMADMFNEPTE